MKSDTFVARSRSAAIRLATVMKLLSRGNSPFRDEVSLHLQNRIPHTARRHLFSFQESEPLCVPTDF
jgi:hypothetical protein